MKKLIALLIAALLLVSTAAMAQEVMTVYTNDTYSIAYPSTWSLDSDDDDLTVYMPDGMSNFIISATPIGMYLTASDLTDLMLETMLQNFQNTYDKVTRVDIPSPVTYGGNEYAALAFTMEYSGLSLYMEQYYLCVDEDMYIFNATYMSPDSEYVDEAHEVLASFTLGGETTVVPVAVAPTVDVPAYEQYTDASGYVITYPTTWYPADENTLAALENITNNNSFDGVNMDTLRNAIASAKDSNLFMLYAPDFVSNLNVVTQELGTSADASLLSSLFPSLLTQYKSMLGATVPQLNSDDTIVTYGDNTYARIAIYYELNGAPMQLEQYMLCPNGTLYTISYTTNSGDETYLSDLEDILANFSVQ